MENFKLDFPFIVCNKDFSRSGLQFLDKLSSITRLVCSKDFSPLSKFLVNQD